MVLDPKATDLSTATMSGADVEAGASPPRFNISPDDLIKLIADRNRSTLRSIGGVHGLARLLHTDLKNGLTADEVNTSLEPRRAKYGQNLFKYPPPKSLFALILEAFKDLTIIILCVAAIVSLVIGLALPKKRDEYMYLEGIAIVIVVAIVVLVQAFIDKQKEAKFRQLNSVKDQFDVQVKRAGNVIAIPAGELVVGDIITVTAGDKLPADAIFIGGSGLKTNESAMTGEPIDIDKSPDDDAFLLSGTSVSEGVGTAIVVAVGEQSQWGVILKALIVEPEDTPLQQRLDRLAWSIGKLGILFAFLTFFVSILRWIAKSNQTGEWDATRVLDFFIDAVTIVVVAIPEGLPLAITLGLAFAMRKMMRDNNLVRRLEACETMGSATQLNADKTGTLTQNRMTIVEALWGHKQVTYSGNMTSEPEIDSFLSEEMRTVICNSMSVNTQANLQFTDGGLINHLGSKTECALLQHVHKWGHDYRKIRDMHPAFRVYMFDSVKKSMSTAEKTSSAVRVYTKGAPDILIHACTSELNDDGVSISQMTNESKQHVLEAVNNMASRGLRTLLLAIRDINHDVTDNEFWEDLPDSNLTYIGVVGIKDPVRPETKEAVRQLKEAGVTVRMVTGDNALTATFIAKESGILDERGIVMEGPDFRKLSEQQLADVALKIQVLARSTPHDKLILVRALKKLNEVTSVTGDGTNDGPALKEADVGFALGIAGTEVAKEACDIVILDDNIQSMTKAVLWGRNVYESIRKFLQFQLVVNVVAVTLNFISACAGRELPLGAVPLLWVNMIMDSMGALALATEPPRPQLLQREPYGRRAPLINREMFRNIAGVSVYQLIVTLVLQFAGKDIFDVEEDELNSIIFNVFVFMQIGSEINSRRIAEKNVFDAIHKSVWFVCIIGITIGIQILLMFLVGDTRVGESIGITRIGPTAWVTSIVLGVLVLPWGFVVRHIPLDWCLGPLDEDPTQVSKLGAIVRKIFSPFAPIVKAINGLIPRRKKNDDKDNDDNDDDGDEIVEDGMEETGKIRSNSVRVKVADEDDLASAPKKTDTDLTDSTDVTNTNTLRSTTSASAVENLSSMETSRRLGSTSESRTSLSQAPPLVRLRVFVHAVAFVNVVSRGITSPSKPEDSEIRPEAYKASDDNDEDAF